MPAQTLSEINKEIERLTRQANELKAKEKQKAVQDVQNLIGQYEISADDLGFELKFRRAAPRRQTKKGAKTAMYQKGDLTWSGGRGAKPNWVKEIIAKEGIEALQKYKVK